MTRAEWVRIAGLETLAASVVVAALVAPRLVPEPHLMVPLAVALLVLLPVAAWVQVAAATRRSLARTHLEP